ncbi:MAG: Na+/H+ antiporter [Actinomycetota bacterium]|nr:Na+/H+ antiporter [Actinomycetota bacterium]
MHVAFVLVCLVASVVAVTALCHRFDLPAPLLLIAVGIAASYLPFVPELRLQPEVVLVGLLPPLLYATAIGSSVVDFNANRRSILLLSIGLVAFTTLGIGVLVHWLLPGVGWAGSFAIGAVVAPPDAVAATAIGRRIGLPRRIVTILEGESLLNDATALVALRTAIAATVAWQRLSLDFLRAAGGGVLVGLVTFALIGFARKHVHDALLDSGLSFLTPFAAYVAAERIGGSGVVAVVLAGLLLGHQAPVLQTAQSRIAERLSWRTISFILEGTVFLLIGLQARWIVSAVMGGGLSWARVVGLCAATLAGVIVLRLVWVFLARYLLVRPGADPESGRVPSWRYTALLGWAGMRGVVTLAAAFVIPEHTPHRDVLLLVAFTVTAGTLFLQGFSLPSLARALRVPSPDPAADALARANLLHQASQAGLAKLDGLDEDDPHSVTDALLERVERRNLTAWERIGAGDAETPSETYSRRRRVMIDAERNRVLEIRDTGSVPHEVVGEVLAMLDVEESMLEYSSSQRDRPRSAERSQSVEGGCEELRREWPDVEPHTAGQCDACLAEGVAWVHLRMCLECGNVACCDSSPNRHATVHFNETGHPVMRSAEPGEDWRWCYPHELTG